MPKEYKLRLPVMKRTCANCGRDRIQHIDEKCLFEASNFKPGGISVQRQTLKLHTRNDDEPNDAKDL